MKKYRGITLIELIIVMAVIGILSKIGYSSYQSYQIRENRELAKQVLVQNAAVMERYYSENGRYLESNNVSWPNILQNVVSQNGVLYQIGVVPITPSSVNQQDFSLLAVPLTNTIQASDGNICINRQGQISWPVASSSCGTTAIVIVPTPSPSPPSFCSGSKQYQPCSGNCDSGTWSACSGNCTSIVICAGGTGCSGNCQSSIIYGGCSGNCKSSTIHGGCSGSCQSSVIYGACAGNCASSKCYNLDGTGGHNC